MSTTANVTDISDKSWDDLVEADRDVLQELAKERDGIDGRKANECLAAALLAYDGRYEEAPEDVSEEYAEEVQRAVEASLNTSAEEADDESYTEAKAEAIADDDEDDSDDEEPAEPPTADDREVEDDEGETEARNQKLGNADKPPVEDASFIIEADILDAWLDYADRLVDECRIHLQDDGLRITAVDPANVGMVNTTLETRAFESFDVGDVGPIGINLDRVTDVVGGADAGDLIHIEYARDTRNLVITYSGHEFTLGLIDPASIRKEPDIPDLDLPVTVEFEEAGPFRTAIKNADNTSDHVALAAEDSVFSVHAEGDTDTYEWAVEDREEGLRFIDYGEARSLFSMDYLKDMRKAWEKDRALEIELGVEFPVTFRQPIGSDDSHVGEATYLLAPRIQSD